MRLFVRGPKEKVYYRQSHTHPSIPSKSEIKPGDTLYSLNADYYVDKVKYSKSDLTIYATKTQIF